MKQEFQINVNTDAEILMQFIASSEREEFHRFKVQYQLSSSDFGDKMSSLLLLRSTDILTARQDALNTITSYQPQFNISHPDLNNITTSDVFYSISSMPCGCPIRLWCCEGIRNDDLRYVIVFTQDLEFLKSSNVNSITKLQFYTSDPPNAESITQSWVSTLAALGMTETQEHASILAQTTSKKIRIWKRSCQMIAIPLMNMFR